MAIEYKISNHYIQYPHAIELMHDRVKQIQCNQAQDMLWLLEHQDIYTIGQSGNSDDILHKTSIPIVQTSRGGKITYHGPGQRIAYIMLNLNKRNKDIKEYVYNLEQWIILTLADFDLIGYRKNPYNGVWVNIKDNKAQKIAAIGIKISKWITYHGISLNINPNLEYYQHIVPCGIAEYGITSMHKMGVKAPIKEIDLALIRNFHKVFKQ